MKIIAPTIGISNMNTPMNKMTNTIIANIMYKRMNLLIEIAFKSFLIAEKLKASDKES